MNEDIYAPYYNVPYSKLESESYKETNPVNIQAFKPYLEPVVGSFLLFCGSVIAYICLERDKKKRRRK